MTHRVIIEPRHRSPQRQFYRATLNGDVIVECSWDPEYAACRKMKALGLSGAVAFFRPGAAAPSSRIRDLKKAALYQVVEADNEGPTRKRWHAPKLTTGKVSVAMGKSIGAGSNTLTRSRRMSPARGNSAQPRQLQAHVKDRMKEYSHA